MIINDIKLLLQAIGMQEILKYLMEHSDERFTKQIQYIIDQLNSDKENDELSESNDGDNDVDDMDEDDDAVEVIKNKKFPIMNIN